MKDGEPLPPHIHSEAALLPWYVNGTLREAERLQVDRHLAACDACRTELEELTVMKRTLTATYASQPELSEAAARRLRDRIGREVRTDLEAVPSSPSLPTLIDRWLRALFTVQWVPTMAVLALAVQIGLLIWVSTPAPPPESVTSRSLSMQTATLSIVFQPNAPEEHIRAMLQSVHGRIIDGPTADGQYRIEVPSADAAALAQKTKTLTERTDLVRSVSVVKP